MTDTEFRPYANFLDSHPAKYEVCVSGENVIRGIGVAQEAKVEHIKIAANHLSAPFFAKFGAKTVLETKDGWAPDMHRVDMELHLGGQS